MLLIFVIALSILLILHVPKCKAESVHSRWNVGSPILVPGEEGSFDGVSVKDPSIVYYGGKWHLFYTANIGGRKIGYVSAKKLEELQDAQRFQLSQIDDSTACAVQVFFFGPQKEWYLIYQTQDSNYQPAYSTTKTIHKPDSWSRPFMLVEKNDKAKWIDFWIICDDKTAYFFYTRAHRDVYVMTTSIQNFPRGFADAQKMFSAVAEAVHIYRAKGFNEYHMFYELSDGRIRKYGFATADHLLGPWSKITDDFAGRDQLYYSDPSNKWTEEVSHGEMLRSGYNQYLEYDPSKTEFLIQGMPNVEHKGPYSGLPWKLGIIKKC